jgi:hypothetical protein
LSDAAREALLTDVTKLRSPAREKLVRFEVLDEDDALTEYGEWVVLFGRNLLEMERRKLKVYGWTGWRTECRQSPNGGKQTREVMAAKSKAEVGRKAGLKRGELNEMCDSGNEEDINAAMAEPGVVFWRPLDARGEPFTRAKEQV